MAIPLIDATVDADNDSTIKVFADMLPVNFVAIGLSSGEEIEFEISNDGGETYEPLRIGGNTYKITYDNPTRMLQSPAHIRLNKPITLNPVSVGASTGVNP